MTDRLTITDEQANEGMAAYNYACALRAEGNTEGFVKFVGSMSAEEQVAMWFSGVAVTVGLGIALGAHLDIEFSDVPRWFRMMADPDLDATNLDDQDDEK